jgi:hypothetical protein
MITSKFTDATVKHSLDGWTAGSEELEPVESTNPLKTPEMQKRLHKLQEWFMQSHEAQSSVRIEQDIDYSYYDHEQWSDEDRKQLEDREQPALVYNKIKPTMDWIVGTERRTRVDSVVLPRKKDGVDAAVAKTQLMKYVSDTSKAPFARSEAFKDAAIVGVGWIETGIRGDETDNPIFVRAESWRNVWYDPFSRERDLSDSRYIFRSKWVDLDIAQAMFPDRSDELKSAAKSVQMTVRNEDEYYLGLHFQRVDNNGRVIGNLSYGSEFPTYLPSTRERLKLVECWYREPKTVQKLKGGDLHGAIFDPSNLLHIKAVQEDFSSIYDAVVMQVRVAIFCDDILLQDQESPYRHNRFPFTPVWGFRRNRDNAPYGVVRGCRDAQDDLNKRYSKAQYILSSAKVIADEDAVVDWDEAMNEVARPDGIIRVRPGKRFDINVDRNLAQEHIALMQQDGLHIQEISGVTSENLGRDTNAQSGKAILAKQNQGSVVTAELFDNLRFAVQHQGEIQLSLIEQFYDQQMDLRILGEGNKPDWTSINMPRFDPSSGSFVFENDITASQDDFVVSEQDFRESMRQAMFEQMTDMVRSLPPDISLQLLDLVFDMADVPGKDEIVSRIRKINGYGDDNKLTPEQEQAKSNEAQMQQEQVRLQLEKLAAEVEKLRADATDKRVNAAYAAMQAGMQVTAAPHVAPAADEILHNAKYGDYGETVPLRQPSPMSQQQQQPMPEQAVPHDPNVGQNAGIETPTGSDNLQGA